MKLNIALLLFAAAIHQTVAWGVFTDFFAFENKYYDISATRTDWYTARSLCRLFGAELMSFDDKETEINFINNELGEYAINGEDFWIGGTNYQSDEYYWDPSGRNFCEGPTNWGPQRLNSTRETSCIAMGAAFYHEWVDADCSEAKLFVCETPFGQWGKKIKEEGALIYFNRP